MWETAKLQMTSSLFFSNNFSTLPNDRIVDRSKLEAFAEKFKLRHTQTVFWHDRMENIFKKKRKIAA